MAPGGHIEKNELPHEAAIREAKEETGLNIELYNSNKLAYLNAEKEYYKEITYANIITSPFPSYNKYSPNRIIITLFGGLSVFVLLLLLISYIERE